MNKIQYHILCSVLFALFLQCGPSIDEADVVARVGDAVLTKEMIREYIDFEGMMPDQENEFVERWIDRELLYKEAKLQGLHKSEDLKYELQLVEKEFLIQALLDQAYAENIKITEDEIKVYYESNKELFQVEEDEVRALHILTKNRSDAQLALTEINAGKAFEDVARERSQGMFAARGGDMGFFKKEDVISEISSVAFKLRVDQISSIFRSSYGYHIIKVIDIRGKNDLKILDQVRNEVIQRLRVQKERTVYYDLLYRLRDKTKVYFNAPDQESVPEDTLVSQRG